MVEKLVQDAINLTSTSLHPNILKSIHETKE